MKMTRTGIILSFILFLFVENAFAQEKRDTSKVSVYAEEDLYVDDPYFWSYTSEIGINFTPLISQLVPFNLGENSAGDIGLKWKKYYALCWAG